MDAFIHERMGKLLLLLDHKIGNNAVQNDSISAFIASYHYFQKAKCVWISNICIREGKQSHSTTYVCLYSWKYRPIVAYARAQIGNIAVKTDSIAAVIASYHN